MNLSTNHNRINGKHALWKMLPKVEWGKQPPELESFCILYVHSPELESFCILYLHCILAAGSSPLYLSIRLND